MKRVIGFVLKLLSGFYFLVFLLRLPDLFRDASNFMLALSGELEAGEAGEAHGIFLVQIFAILLFGYLWHLGGRLMVKEPE